MTEAKVILPKLFNVTVGAPGSAGCGSPSKNGKQQELPRKKDACVADLFLSPKGMSQGVRARFGQYNLHVQMEVLNGFGMSLCRTFLWAVGSCI